MESSLPVIAHTLTSDVLSEKGAEGTVRLSDYVDAAKRGEMAPSGRQSLNCTLSDHQHQNHDNTVRLIFGVLSAFMKAQSVLGFTDVSLKGGLIHNL